MKAESIAGWGAWHFYYQGDRSRLLMDGLLPELQSLLAKQWIDRFFFMRFSLGGPHIRLRVRWTPNSKGIEVGDSITAAAHGFFERHPSQPRYSRERIQEHNDFILARDQGETDNTVYPNNSVRQAAFVPEATRYGGPDVVHHSFDFFNISSLQTLECLHSGAGSRSRLLSDGFRLLARQALGFADDAEHLLRLLRYPIEIEALLKKADQVFEKQSGPLRALLSNELTMLLDSPKKIEHPDLYLAHAAQSLTDELHGLEDGTRRRILTSQMHMTANRLGFENAEETYLSRLIWRAARDLKEHEPSLWERLENDFADRRASRPRSTGALQALLTRRLEQLGLHGLAIDSDPLNNEASQPNSTTGLD